MKKVICILLAAVLLVGVAGALTVKADKQHMLIYMDWWAGWRGGLESKEALTFHYEGDTIVVDGWLDELYELKDIRRMEIPAEYAGHPVRFEENAFSSLPVRKLIFEEGVEYIPNNLCSGNTVLEEVELPRSLKEIGASAFENCTNLAYVNTVNAEKIGEKAFSGCEKLNITLGENVKDIKESTFEGCVFVNGLDRFFEQEIEFVNGKVTVGGVTYTLKNGELWVSEGDKGLYGEVIIPKEIKGYPVTQLVNPGFYDCKNITRVVMPETMKSIGTSVFWNCESLEEVVLNDGLEMIGQQAFEYCKSLTEVAIPDTVTSIGDMAFKGSGISDIKIGNGVKSIGSGAFWDCDKLESLVIPDNVTTLGYPPEKRTNGYFGGLKMFEYPSPFYYMDRLKTVTIGKGIEKIYPETFNTCSMLESIAVSAENQSYPAVGGVLYTKDMKKMVFFPQGKMVRVFAVPEGVAEIGEKAMQTNLLNELYVPDSLDVIGSGNTLPSMVKRYKTKDTLPEAALNPYPEKGVYNYINWELKDGVLTFSGQGSLLTTWNNQYTPIPWKIEDVKEVVIGGEGISTIYGVFKDHINLKKITLPQSIIEINEESFRNCKSLESVIIPQNVYRIGEMAFAECYNLKEVKVLSTVDVKIYKGAFDIADGATVHLSDGVKWMDSFAFTHIEYNAERTQYSTNSVPQNVTVIASKDSYAYNRAKAIGLNVMTSANAIEENSVTYVAAGAIFKESGMDIHYDHAKKIAVCGIGSRWMIFSDGNDKITTNNGTITMSAPAKWIDGVFMLPEDVLDILDIDLATITGQTVTLVPDSGNTTIEDKNVAEVPYSDTITVTGGNMTEKPVGGRVMIALDDITVSQIPEPSNGPVNMIDGLTVTRWAAHVPDKNNPCSAVFDLGEVYELEAIGLSFNQGSTRTTEFSVEVSVDGVRYTPAIARRNSSGTTEAVEYYSLKNIKARYVKLSGYGNSSPYSNVMNWFSPTEVEIYKTGNAVGTPVEKPAEPEVTMDGKVNLEDVKVTASIMSEPENGPGNLYDNDFVSYCVLYVPNESLPEYIEIDLGEVKTVEKLALAFRNATSRTTYFDIRVSKDGGKYETVVPKSGSGGDTNGLQYFDIKRDARYIRIYGYSNTYNMHWVSITEAAVFVNE